MEWGADFGGDAKGRVGGDELFEMRDPHSVIPADEGSGCDFILRESHPRNREWCEKGWPSEKGGFRKGERFLSGCLSSTCSLVDWKDRGIRLGLFVDCLWLPNSLP